MRNNRDALRSPHAGFTLIEVVVVVAVIALLAGLVVPSVVGVTDDAKASKILGIYDTLKKACERHYANTGTLAREYTSSTSTGSHELSLTQTTAGWRGPYIDHPLVQADNPFGSHILVYEDFTSGGASAPGGFDLMGTGTDNATGTGQFVMFYSVPQAVAQLVDDTLDNGVGGTWSSSGRVEYDSSNSRLNIYLMDN